MIDRTELDQRVASVDVRAPHAPHHIRFFVDAVLDTDTDTDGVLVECGAYQGAGTAKLSHLADMLGRRLYVFDSFRGLPEHDERHTARLDGRDISGWFPAGAFAGSLAEVQANVARYGIPDVVTYVPGWFADTLPHFSEPVAAAYLDCDLAASTTTCLEQLWLHVTGCIVSQDGDFPLVIEAMQAWLSTAEPQPSRVIGLGVDKMVRFDR